VAQYRKKAGQIVTDLQGVAGEISNYTVRANGWLTNATNVVTRVVAWKYYHPLVDKTNALADLNVLQNYVTGTLSSATVELKGLSDMVGSNRAEMLVISDSGALHRKLIAMTNVPVRCAEVIQSVSKGTDKVRKTVDRIEALGKKLESKMAAAKAVADRAAREKEEAAKVEAERLAKERAEAAEKAEIQAEIVQIDTIRKENEFMIQQHLFKEAQAKIEQGVKGLKTDEGKAAGKQTIKAYQFLTDLKTLIIDGIQADVKSNPDSGYAFGWLGSKDILGADTEKVIIRGGQVPWNTLPPAQMMRFVQRYVEGGDLTKREKAQCYFAVALYIYEATGRNEKHRAQAAKYLNEAVRFHPSVEDLAKAILPDLELK